MGQKLQKARLERGLDLAAIAARTKIKEKYLEAIEADDLAGLPSGFFFKSFVEQYAQAVSIDTSEIHADLDRLLSTQAPLPLPGQDGLQVRRPEPFYPVRRNKRRKVYASLAGLLLVLLGSSGVYAWWYSDPSPRSAAPPVSAPVAATFPSHDIQALPAPENKVLLDLTAREETWLSVSSDGRMVFTGTLGANQTKTVQGKEFAKLRVGNAAGIDVRLNGKQLGPLGPRGQVLVVVFTPDKVQVVAAPKESGD